MFRTFIRPAATPLPRAFRTGLALLSMAATVFSVACSGGQPTGPSPVTGLSQASTLSSGSSGGTAGGGTQMVPITGQLTGYSFPLGNGVAVGCPANYNRTGLELSGDVSHLGASTFAAQHCNRTLSANPLVVDTSGGGSIAAANGDELSMTYVGTSAAFVVFPTVVHFELAATINGGTGRFAGATGSSTISCVRTTPDPATLPPHTPAYANAYECSFSGQVSSVGSSK
jgi:hypothetical protein